MSQASSSAAGAPPVVIRDARESDMPAIREIYAEAVLRGLASFEETPPTLDEMLSRRVRVLNLGLPWLAAERDGRVLGYAYATAHHTRSGYRFTVEDSVYVADGMRRQGVGRALLGALIEVCEAGPWRQMVAIIGDSGNRGSIALHESMGFRMVGTFQAIGFKLGRWVDTVLMQRPLGDGNDTLPGGGD